MFADSKNPLAADLIKEFKAISIDKSTRQNHGPAKKSISKVTQSIDSPSNILPSHLRTNESERSRDEIPTNSDKPDIFKRYSVNMIDLSPDSENKTFTPSTKSKNLKSSKPRVSKKLDKILALKAKSKPVPLPSSQPLKEHRTKSVQNTLTEENTNEQGEVVLQRSVSLDSWDSDDDESEIGEEGGYGSFYEEPNSPASLISNIDSPTSIASKRGYFPASFRFKRGSSDSGYIKPPIPTPRPKGIENEGYEDENVDHLSHLSQNMDEVIDQKGAQSRNPALTENIYESLDFRSSIDVDSEDDHLPDILKHTKSIKSRNEDTTDEIYESFDHYQADEDYNGYLKLASLEPPTPSKLSPQFKFPRRETVSELSSDCFIQPVDAISTRPREDGNLENINTRLRTSTTSLVPMSSSPHLGNMNFSQRRETVGTLFLGNVKKKGFQSTSSLPNGIIEEGIASANSLEKFPWFKNISRKRAEKLIKEVGCDGTFLVRESKNGGITSPYTLTLLYRQNMYHINIRAFSNGKYALGKSKNNEMIFDSVEQIIKRHRYEPLMLVGLDGQHAGGTILSRFPSD